MGFNSAFKGLNLQPPRFCFSTGNGWLLLSDDWRQYDHNRYTFFSCDLTHHENLFSDRSCHL